MPKCIKCGKKGLFLKIDNNKLCPNCVINSELEEQERKLKASIEEQERKLKSAIEGLNKEKTELKQEIHRLNTNRKSVYDNVRKDVMDELAPKLSSVEAEIVAKNIELNEAKTKLDELKPEFDSMQKKYIKVKTQFESYQNAIKAYLKSDEEILNENFISELSPTIELQLNCMNVKQLKGLYNQNKKLIQDCLKKYEHRYTTKTNMALYKLMVIALEAELQNILYNIKYGGIDKATLAVKEMTGKYLAVAIDGNQSIAPTMKKFIGEIEFLFIETVKIEYEYFVQKERIKEEQRALREQMKQEAEERKQLEQQRKQIEKEESKYNTEMENIAEQLKSTTEQSKVNQLQRRLEELQEQLSTVKTKKNEIINLQNGKAGHVYVISNLGSFGDKVFKIGMTRRLEPMDRINELGNASIPFPFDVHSFIFSDDAVGLENTLHKELHKSRVNKINLRKEFFNITIDELEEIVYKHQPTAEFNKTMLAEQYYQSCSTNVIREALTDFGDNDMDE